MLVTARRNWPPEDYPNLSFVFGDAGAAAAGRRQSGHASSARSRCTTGGRRWPPSPRSDACSRPEGSFVLFDLRRDSPRIAYWALAIAQRFFTPPAIRRTNGAVGSFWSAYTVPELTDLFKQAGWASHQISRGPAWLVAGVPR